MPDHPPLSAPDKSDDPSYARHARGARDYQWHFMERCLAAGTLWFCAWNKERRAEGPDEMRVALLSGNDIWQWVNQHHEWFVVGEWDDARAARPITLTDAGKAALADRATYDLEPYHGGLIEPGWTATPSLRSLATPAENA